MKRTTRGKSTRENGNRRDYFIQYTNTARVAQRRDALKPGMDGGENSMNIREKRAKNGLLKCCLATTLSACLPTNHSIARPTIPDRLARNCNGLK